MSWSSAATASGSPDAEPQLVLDALRRALGRHPVKPQPRRFGGQQV
jgi:hypothetical protein